QKPDIDKEKSLAYLQKNQVILNWYPKIRALVSRGLARSDDETNPNRGWLSQEHIAFLDMDAIYFELQRYKAERAWYNFNIPRESLPDILADSSWYQLLIPEDELAFDSFEKVRIWQEIA